MSKELFRSWCEPRRHVPRITFTGRDWCVSVRDQHNNHHERFVPTWDEARLHAAAWAHINHAHGLTDNEPLHGWLA